MKQNKKYKIKAPDGTGSIQDIPFAAEGNFEDYHQKYNIGTPHNVSPPNPNNPDYMRYKLMFDPTLAINTLATGVTAFANTINSNKAFRKEQDKYYQELRGTPSENNYTVNDNPIYMANGGVMKFPYGGGPLTAEGAKEILRDGKVHGKALTPAQKRYFGYIAGGGKPKGKYGLDIEAEGGENYRDTLGNVMKISDSAPSHEEGGVDINNVDAVLEDRSSTDTDDVANLLRIKPTQFKAMFGFDSKKSVSHSEALDLVDKYYKKKADKYSKNVNNTLETLNGYPDNVYANNSLGLNLKTLSDLPNRDHIFDYLLKHQESVKAANGIDNMGNKYAIGGYTDPNDPYNGGRTSQNTKYNLPIDIGRLNLLWKQVAGIDGTNMKNEDFQSAIYDWALQNDPDQIRKVWSTWKNTNKGKTLGIGKNYDFNNLSDDQLKNLKNAYVDGNLGARTLVPKQNYDIVPQGTPSSYPNTPETLTGNPSLTTPDSPLASSPTEDNSFTIPKTQQPSKFNEPLRWYDLAGPLATLASSDRTPAKYNPVKFNEVRLKLENPEPSLAAGQRQYNAATALLPSDDTTAVAKLFAQKYATDNQVIAGYENANTNIKNQEVQYNASVRDRQSEADQRSRAVFEDQMLSSKEAERQQKLSALDDIFNRIALNRKLNREGNLIQQLSPNYNQYGQYNGNQRYFVNNTQGQGQAATANGVTFKDVVDNTGQRYKFAYDAKGNLISKNKVIN